MDDELIMRTLLCAVLTFLIGIGLGVELGPQVKAKRAAQGQFFAMPANVLPRRLVDTVVDETPYCAEMQRDGQQNILLTRARRGTCKTQDALHRDKR